MAWLVNDRAERLRLGLPTNDPTPGTPPYDPAQAAKVAAQAVKDARIARMSPGEKLDEAFGRAFDRVGPAFRHKIEALWENKWFVAGLSLGFIGAHFFGLGEAADAVGLLFLAHESFEISFDVLSFFEVVHATTDQEVEKAADALARAAAQGTIDLVLVAVTYAAKLSGKRLKGWLGLNCFPAGTLVACANGLKKIEEVNGGEAVWSYDFTAGEWVLRHVEMTHTGIFSGQFITLQFEDGTILEVTEDHPIWVTEGENLDARAPLKFHDAYEESGLSLPGRWVHSQELQVGDKVYVRSGSQLRVERITIREDRAPVYNLSVSGLPYYAVGPLGILVHNSETIPTGEPLEPAPTAPAVPAIRLRPGTTMAEILQGVPDDAMIHLTRQPSVGPIVRSGGIEYGSSMVRAGDVRGMTLQQFQRDVVGPLAEARAADANTFLIVHSNNPQFGTMRPWPRPNTPLPGTNVQEFRPTSPTNIMPNDIIEVQPPAPR